jgi:DNA primase
MYSKSDINKVRETISILDFLEARGVSFKKTGTSHVGLCPIHNEKSGSFHVREDNNTFHCFGCGAGGDIISLVQSIEGLSFTGAMQLLAEDYNIELEKVDSDPEFKQLQRLYKITQLASKFYREQYIALPDSHPAKTNLKDRLLQSEGDKDLNIGYAPMSGLLDVLFAEKFSKEEIASVGLIKINEDGKTTQLFRNRLIWTINDIQGRPIAFSARKIVEEDMGPKYINSPATRLYNKSKVLMGLEVARKFTSKTQSLYVVEGATDIMAFRAAGFENVVATCGTAFGPEHATVVLGLAANTRESNRFKVYFCFDGDSAGLEAAKKVFNKNKNILSISSVIKFDNGDPCDIRLHGGNLELQNKVKTGGVPIVEFMLLEEKSSWDISKPEELAMFIEASKKIIDEIPSQVEKEAYYRKLASWTGVSISRIGSASRSNNSAKQASSTPDNSSLYENLFAAIVQYPSITKKIFNNYRVIDSYFPEAIKPAIIMLLENEEPDFSSPEYSKYMFIKLSEKERAESVVEDLTKKLLKSLYHNDVKEVESKVDLESDEGFNEYFALTKKLKEKYFIV